MRKSKKHSAKQNEGQNYVIIPKDAEKSFCKIQYPFMITKKNSEKNTSR
jgi:hypothetical protein